MSCSIDLMLKGVAIMEQQIQLNYRKAEETDIDTILRMFKEVFNEDRTVPCWKWQYMDDVHGWGWIMLAENESSIIAQSAIVRQHLNVLGCQVVSGQLCDAMVKSTLRGMNVFSGLAANQFKLFVEGGGEAVFGFPSRNSFPGSYPMAIRKLNFRRVTNLKYYNKRIGVDSISDKIVNKLFKIVSSSILSIKKTINNKRWAKNIEMYTSDNLPGDSELILKQIRDYEVISVWKDSHYLKWRYEQHPEYKYKFHILKLDGQTEGIVISRKCKNIISICEILHRRKNVHQSALLITHVIQSVLNTDASTIEFYGHDNGFFEAVFRLAGFNYQPFSQMILIQKSFSPNLVDLLSVPENWSISYGDTDSI